MMFNIDYPSLTKLLELREKDPKAYYSYMQELTSGIQIDLTDSLVSIPPSFAQTVDTLGSGDYLVLAPYYSQLGQRIIPAFRKCFPCAEYHPSLKRMELANDGLSARVFFSTTERPDSLMGFCANAVFIDCRFGNINPKAWETILDIGRNIIVWLPNILPTKPIKLWEQEQP